MDAPSGDHVAAVAPDIDSLAKATDGVPNPSITAPKITMPSLAGFDRHRLWKAAVLRLQFLQTRLADVAIDIEHEDTGRPPGGDADVGVWPSFPPGFDDRSIGGGVLDAIGGARMLAGMSARLTGRT